MAMIDKVGACVALAGILAFGGVAHAVTPQEKCEPGRGSKFAFVLPIERG